MSIQDKVSGRLKQAAGDLAGDKNLHGEGVREERKAEAKRELREAEQRVEHLRDEIARLEYESVSEGVSGRTEEDHSAAADQRSDVRSSARQSRDDVVDTARGERR